MIQGLLFIIKIIGWGLLGILGLILGIFLVVLFSAIRYQIDGSKQEKLSAKVHITWLLWILSITACYEEEMQLTIKLFGRTVWKRKKAETEENLEFSEDIENMPGLDSGQEWMPEAEPASPVFTEPVSKPKTEKEDSKNEEKPEKKGSAAEKIKTKLAAFVRKLQYSFQEICGKLKQVQDKLDWAREKWTAGLAYLENPQNQKSARLIIRQIKKISRYVLPKKGTISVTFGRDDPYLMGKVLTYASLLYPFTHKIVIFQPVFGENILEGEVHVRGHIRIGIILGMMLRLLIDRNIRTQLWYLIRPKKKRKQKREHK